jgi:MarR family transcriptional regulator for hemolysin
MKMATGMYQKDLAAAIGLDGSSLVRLLDLLEARELIERCVDEHGRRARRVHLTDPGRWFVSGIRKRLHGIEDELLMDLEEPEIRAVLAVFESIQRRLAGKSRKEPDAT